MLDSTSTQTSPSPDRKDLNPSLLGQITKFLLLPMVLYVVYTQLYSRLMPSVGDADIDLLLFQIGLSVLMVGWVLFSQRQVLVGWVRPKGWTWIVVVGPLWLSVLTPIGMAAQFYQANPGKLLPLFLVSLLVGVNEETWFRGLIMRGLAQRIASMWAVVLSSLAFGGLHALNLEAGGDPLFVVAQMIAAAGTGTILAAVTLSARSIVPAVIVHFAMDFVGLAALGGYGESIQSPELAPMLIISGMVGAVWGLTWSWFLIRRERRLRSQTTTAEPGPQEVQ